MVVGQKGGMVVSAMRVLCCFWFEFVIPENEKPWVVLCWIEGEILLRRKSGGCRALGLWPFPPPLCSFYVFPFKMERVEMVLMGSHAGNRSSIVVVPVLMC